MPAAPTECAQEILEVVPFVVRATSAEMRRQPLLDLSLPRFRALSYLSRQEDASLSDLAECPGLPLPSSSKMGDRLVPRGRVTRRQDPVSRRRVILRLTPESRQSLSRVRAATLEKIGRWLRSPSAEGRLTILRAMSMLREAFPDSPKNLLLSETPSPAPP